MLRLHVTATDAKGKTWHLPVDRKGFAGEEMAIAAANVLAYQDIGVISESRGSQVSRVTARCRMATASSGSLTFTVF